MYKPCTGTTFHFCKFYRQVVFKHFVLGRLIHSLKRMRILKSFCVCGLHLVIFIVLELKLKNFLSICLVHFKIAVINLSYVSFKYFCES